MRNAENEKVVRTKSARLLVLASNAGKQSSPRRSGVAMGLAASLSAKVSSTYLREQMHRVENLRELLLSTKLTAVPCGCDFRLSKLRKK